MAFRKYKNVLSIILCLFLLISMYVPVSDFLMRKNSYEKNADFYNYEGNYDVLFLGTSHMVMGISPMELWNDYGITSYNLGDFGQTTAIDYWVLKNALDYTTPKLVVVDVYRINEVTKYVETYISQMHNVFDSMPLSKNKISAVFDLLPEGKRMEFLFPFSFYHTRWDEIDSTFWANAEPTTEKGANIDSSDTHSYAFVNEVSPPEIIDKDQMNTGETLAKEYLRKIIQLCQSENIDVLLTKLPFSPSKEQQEWINSARIIADEYNVEFLDFNVEDTFINYNTDFCDNGHLNSSGTRKTTELLGTYIVENYDLKDWRSSKIAHEWNQDYVEYTNYKLDWLKLQTSLDSYLMLLADKKLDIIIEIYNSDIWLDPVYVHLFENLGVERSLITKNTDSILIKEGGKRVNVLYDFRDTSSAFDTCLGQLYRRADKSKDKNNVESYNVYLDGRFLYSVTPEENADIKILVLDKDTLEIYDNVLFSYLVENQNYKLTTTAINR